MNPGEDPSSPLAWLERARSNLNLARGGHRIKGVYLEDLCFEAQQAAEKALKAVCISLGADFPKTHSLPTLLDILEGAGLVLPPAVINSAILTQYAVRTRYPGGIEPITRSEYDSAVDLAGSVITWAESVLEEGT
jgi:HEPN domain-containing protein